MALLTKHVIEHKIKLKTAMALLTKNRIKHETEIAQPPLLKIKLDFNSGNKPETANLSAKQLKTNNHPQLS